MKRSFITLYALAATALTAVAQPRFTSNTETYDFGQIEWKHPVTVQYSITNTGNQPLVLTDVEPGGQRLLSLRGQREWSMSLLMRRLWGISINP